MVASEKAQESGEQGPASCNTNKVEESESEPSIQVALDDSCIQVV